MLIDAGVSDGEVRTHDRTPVGKDATSVTFIEPETESGIDVKGPRYFAPQQSDRKVVGRVQERWIRVNVTTIAKDLGTRGSDGNFTSIEKDADELADEQSELIERTLLSRYLRYRDANGEWVDLGERDFKLIGSSAVRDQSTGERMIGAVASQFEALVLTNEGDPSNTINR